ncbi:MAG: small, acid-soluble spore protein, alpha/beta type [Clostridiaceae bacterium]|nr:small, acid-soluble spore protein, alpha/beta type [Clostridiaceae bacterium]
MSRKKILDPNAVKAIEDFKLEMGAEIGIPEDEYIDDEFMYVDSGDLIPREIIEEAERQFANKQQERLD